MISQTSHKEQCLELRDCPFCRWRELGLVCFDLYLSPFCTHLLAAMPPRARSHSYNGPVTAKDINAHPNFEPPHHPVQGTISEHARAAHNLRVLKRHYRPIKGILDQIPHCILRLASGGDSNNWELLRGPEGPLFLCEWYE